MIPAPDLEALPESVKGRAKLLILNYPSNPLAAVAEPGFFERVVEFAPRYRVVVLHDAAYSELTFDGYRPPSFLQTPGAMEVGIEFNSLSKTFNLAGARVAYAVGNRQVGPASSSRWTFWNRLGSPSSRGAASGPREKGTSGSPWSKARKGWPKLWNEYGSPG